jgi:hypothetical protein
MKEMLIYLVGEAAFRDKYCRVVKNLICKNKSGNL